MPSTGTQDKGHLTANVLTMASAGSPAGKECAPHHDCGEAVYGGVEQFENGLAPVSWRGESLGSCDLI